MLEKIIIGRDRSDLKEFGDKGTVFIGKHIVGEGEEAHLTNPVHMDVVRPHILLVCGKRGSGKCVDENTMISMEDGSYVPIKDFKPGKVFGLDGKLKSSPLEVTEFFTRKVGSLIRVKTRSGKEIRLTPEHPLLTVKGWKEARELGIGSRIATARKSGCFGNFGMEECKVKLLAYLIAEGHMSNNFVLFSNNDDKIVQDFFDAVNAFDSTLKISNHSHPHCYRISKAKRKADMSCIKRGENGKFAKGSIARQVKSSINLWLREMGIYGKLSREKFIPADVFKLSRSNLSLFLNRLFSCDGSIYRKKTGSSFTWQVSYCSASERMISQIHHLLLRFGIISRIRERKIRLSGKEFRAFEIIIGAENATRFAEEIGFYGEKEIRAGGMLSESGSQERNPNVDTIPKEIWDVYRPKNWAEVGKSFGYSTPKALRSSIGYSPSPQKLAQIALLDKNDTAYQLASADIFWDEIILLEMMEGEFNVCDISVPEFHNFFASDFIVHNSYSGGVIAEGMMLLPDEIKQNLSIIMIDTMGIYWSMKKPNEKEEDILKEWNLKPQPMENMRFFIPKGYVKEYEKSGVDFDSTFTLPCGEITSQDWMLTFGFSPIDPHGIAIDRAVKRTREKHGDSYEIQDIIKELESDQKAEQKVKDALIGMFNVAEEWGVFEKEGTHIDTFFEGGKISVIDISHYVRSSSGWSVRSMVIGLLSRKIFQSRLMARKAEEIETITGERHKSSPMAWIMIDECLPFDSEIVTDKHHTPLGEIVERFERGEKIRVMGYDCSKNEYGYYDVTKVFRRPKREIIEIITETGRKIKCTPDHKILTRNGFIPAKEAKEMVIPAIQYYSQDEKLIKARISGHLFGDGWLSPKAKTVGFSGKGNSRDLERIKNDLLTIGFKSGNIHTRITKSKIREEGGRELNVRGTSHSFSSSWKAYEFFSNIGIPAGEKTISASLIPRWILESSDKEKAEFLAAWMGSDATTPIPARYSKVTSDSIRLSFNRIEKNEKQALMLANQVRYLFKDLGIDVVISRRKGNIRNDGHKTQKFVITISKGLENTIKYLERVGYRYCERKEIEGVKWLGYLKHKAEMIRERKSLRGKMREIQKSGKSLYRISKELSIPYYQAKWWAKHNDNPSVTHDTPSFHEWIKTRLENNLLYEKILSVKEAPPEHVYDISVDKVHNFVANGCIVHNCHQFIPSEGTTAASEPLLTLIKEGREPGISLLLITQIPNKLHSDALAQSDIVISHHLTSEADMKALRGIMQTYAMKDIEEYMNTLPKKKGVALILDDNSERIYTIQIRPRLSWHAGGSPMAIKRKGLFNE